MISKCFRNEIDLFYDTETGEIKNSIRMGCNRNAIIIIPMFSIWAIHREQDGLYMISNNGLRIELNNETSEWFGGLI